jgi:hypothetical protein
VIKALYPTRGMAFSSGKTPRGIFEKGFRMRSARFWIVLSIIGLGCILILTGGIGGFELGIAMFLIACYVAAIK